MKMQLSGIALLLLLCFNSAMAAEANTGQQAQEQSSDDSGQQDTESDPANSPETDEDEVEDDPEASPARVIPTEQISQDLGVSFPVDI